MIFPMVSIIAVIAIIIIILYCINCDSCIIINIVLSIIAIIAILKKPNNPFNETVDIEDAEENNIIEAEIKQSKTDMQAISHSNKMALHKLYNRNVSTVDDKMLDHRKRIGGRDKNAVITQIRSRRNNSMEPYYRQELSQHGNSKWWDVESILSRKATPSQQSTIMKGR